MSVIPPLFYFLTTLLGLKQDIYFEDIVFRANLPKNQGVLMLKYPKMQSQAKLSAEDSLKLYQKAPFRSVEGKIHVKSFKMNPKKSLLQIRFEAQDTKSIYTLLQLIEITDKLMKEIPPKHKKHIQQGDLVMAIPKDQIKGKIKTNGTVFYDEDEKVNLIIWSGDVQEIEIALSTPFYHGEQYLELYNKN